jgi:hydrogenase small subunit
MDFSLIKSAKKIQKSSSTGHSRQLQPAHSAIFQAFRLIFNIRIGTKHIQIKHKQLSLFALLFDQDGQPTRRAHPSPTPKHAPNRPNHGNLLRGDAPPGHLAPQPFLKYCSLTATSLGLGPAFVPQIAHAMETKPRTPVLWLHGLECTCCSESFIRSAHPLAKDVVLSMISLDYDDTLMAAAGHQAEAILEEIMTKYKGQYILAVEGNPPLNEDGMFCIQSGKPFIDQLKHVAKDCQGHHRLGLLRQLGLRAGGQAQPDAATPIDKVITDKPIIKVPGCPPIAEVMTGVITYMLTFDKFPNWTARAARRCSTASASTTSATAARTSTPASSSRPGTTSPHARATASTRSAARARPPTTPAPPCVERGHELPDQGRPRLHRLLGRRLLGQGIVLRPPDHIHQFGIEANADQIGGTAAGVVGAAVAAHAAVSAIKRATKNAGHRQNSTGQCPPAPAPNTEPENTEEHPWVLTKLKGFKMDNTGRRIVVDPVTRIEGHMRCEVNLDSNNVIRNACPPAPCGAASK